MIKSDKKILWFEELGIGDVGLVGGKNASLGEMYSNLRSLGVSIPNGFAITALAYRDFIEKTGLKKEIETNLRGLNTRDLTGLARRGKIIRTLIKEAVLPADLEREILNAYGKLESSYGKNVDVAVRSSATAEDLPGASFAGEHETYLNIRGGRDLLTAVRAAMASLFTDRAISYRVDKGFDHFRVALSVGVQKMVRSDLGAAGVMFTLDTESGFADAVIINGSWGLGEMIVLGEVTPDEFLIFKKNLGKAPRPIIGKKLGAKNRKMIYSAGHGIKRTRIVPVSVREKESFVLTDAEILRLAEWGVLIEKHYSEKNGHWSPMDMEWAKDGRSGELFIVQARPETVHAGRDFTKLTEYVRREEGRVIVSGASVGSKIAVGRARVILDVKQIKQFKKGEILVTDMTDPDWEPIMKIAGAIVTDKGGRTSHAAIVSRELGIPCVVGTERATQKIKTGMAVTVDTVGSEGLVLAGTLKYEVKERDLANFPVPRTKVMMNIATPETAFEKSFLPNGGVGLAREEFIIASDVGIHPLALINFSKIRGELTRSEVAEISRRAAGWKDMKKFYVDKLAYGIGKIGAAFYPKPVIVRFSDFKTNEYRELLGGRLYEPAEENPMIGWRGALRYYHPDFAPAFALECQALRQAREEMGLVNIIPMIPFCRTVTEGERVISLMKKNGLDREKDRMLRIYVMCEIPANVVLADKFLDIFDGMSIGSNDLTQLTVGIDRDGSVLLRGIANESDEAVKELIRQVIRRTRGRKKYIGICGQGPSDLPGFAEFLVGEGIESISLNPDTVVATTLKIAEEEKKTKK